MRIFAYVVFAVALIVAIIAFIWPLQAMQVQAFVMSMLSVLGFGALLKFLFSDKC